MGATAAAAQQEPEGRQSPRPPRPPRSRAGLWLLAVLAVLVLGSALAVAGLTGRPVGLPVWAVAEAEARLNRDLAPVLGAASVSVGEIEVMLDAGWVPRLRLRDLRLLAPGGAALVSLPEARLSFDPGAALSGQIRVRTLHLSGARLAASRDAEGRFDLALGAGGGPQIRGLGDLFALVDRVLATPALSALVAIEAEALTLTLTDRRVMRTWQVGDGRLRIDNRPGEIALELGFSLVQGADLPAQALLQVVHPRGGDSNTRLTATITRVAAADLAAQVAPLGWLAVLDAPISGQIAAALDGDAVAAFEGNLSIGAGALRPTPETPPIAFRSAGLELSYDPATGRLGLGRLEVDSGALRLAASGQGWLLDGQGGRMAGPLTGRVPAGFLSQIAISQVMVDPEGLFSQPVRFSQGALDLRLRLDPFALEVGQLSLIEAGERIAAKGRVAADPAGWQVAMDFAVDEIGVDRLVTLWPVRLVPKTRNWMAENITEGRLFDLDAALRLAPGQEPRLSLDYAFRDARVRFMRTLPPIEAGYGHASILDKVYTLVLDRGRLEAPQGGTVEVGGSVMTVADITRKPADAEIALVTDSSVTAALSLLDEPPFRFLTKAGRPVDLAEGRARLETRLKLPLKQKVLPHEVDYAVQGAILDLRTDRLVPGHRVTAARLELSADRGGLRLSGPGRIGTVPFRVEYTQPFGPDAGGRARIAGEVTLSPEAVREFRLGLPDGSVTGEGPAGIDIALRRGSPPLLRLGSDLRGLRLAAPGLGWTKPASEPGRLDLVARLGPAPVIEALELSGGGLQAEGGRITLNPGGGLAEAGFARVRLQGWLDAPVRLVGQGPGQPPAVTVEGGTVDLAQMGRARAGAPAGGEGIGPLTLALERLQVTDDIALTGLSGRFTPLGGFNGSFTAQVNGAAAVEGTVVPSRHGSAVRIRSQDAGAVLAAAGAFRGARGGALDLTLTPRAEPGSYDGTVALQSFRVQGASVMAELLSAISVVGLIQQLGGEGIPFSSAEARLLLQPGRLTLREGSAVGASLGLSLEGRYDSRQGALDMEGVISPVYLVNGIGAVLTRRGEGLIGFNFALSGPARAPQVSVNPLSILTPGMFRQIFRRGPPQAGDSGG
jgi:hypothetical protein